MYCILLVCLYNSRYIYSAFSVCCWLPLECAAFIEFIVENTSWSCVMPKDHTVKICRNRKNTLLDIRSKSDVSSPRFALTALLLVETGGWVGPRRGVDLVVTRLVAIWNETAGIQVLVACPIRLPSLFVLGVTKRNWRLRSRKRFVCCSLLIILPPGCVSCVQECTDRTLVGYVL
jgi:hypothetical protein